MEEMHGSIEEDMKWWQVEEFSAEEQEGQNNAQEEARVRKQTRDAFMPTTTWRERKKYERRGSYKG